MKKNLQISDENPWDYENVPMIKMPIKTSPRIGFYNSVQKVIEKFSHEKKYAEKGLQTQIKKARQMAYIEPWFQFFLPETLKNKLHISTIGCHFWVIAAEKPIYANRFKFYQKEIRSSLEAHLNKISKKDWSIPEFKVRSLGTFYEDSLVNHDKSQYTRYFPIKANKEIRKSASKESLEDILKRFSH